MSHSKLSPSARHRWGKCPASVKECEGKISVSGPAALDGTHTHALLEDAILKGGVIAPADQLFEYDHDGEKFSFMNDAERVERVQFVLDYIVKRMAEIPIELGTPGAQVQIFAERRVDPEWVTSVDELDGTVDVTLVCGSYFELIDLKDGMGEVLAALNPQLEQYGLGVYSESVQDGNKFTHSRLTIAQPKMRLFGKPGIDSVDVSDVEYSAIAQQIQSEVNATRVELPAYIPGESQCRYCLAEGCSAPAKKALADSGVTFQDMSTQLANINESQLTDDQLRKIIESEGLWKLVIESAQIEAQRRMNLGQQIPGLKMVMSSGGRESWNLDDEEMIVKLNRMKVPKDKCYKKKALTPKQAIALRWKNTKDEDCKLSERQIENLKRDFIKKTKGSPIVVADADTRTAIAAAPTNMFQNNEQPAIPDWLKG